MAARVSADESLKRTALAIAAGASVADAEAQGAQAVLKAGFEVVDYFETRAADDLTRLGPGPTDVPARVLAAARLGRTRLLDNVAV